MENPNSEFTARDIPLDADTRFVAPGGESIEGLPLGTPPVDYDVRSVYDVRPIGAYDFNILVSVAVGSTATSFVADFAVPSGFVCVLREVEAFFDTSPTGLVNYTDGRVSLTRDKVDYVNNKLIPMGSHSRIIKTFLLADEFQMVGAKFTLGTGLAPVFSDTFYALMYGNMIPKLGRPYPYEIANPTGGSEKRDTYALPLTQQQPILPAAPVTAPVQVVPRIQTASLPPPQAAMPTAPAPVKAAMRKPPFEVRMANALVRGVPSRVPVTPKAGGFIPLTPAQQKEFAEYLATLK
jgi:hypothetical protein